MKKLLIMFAMMLFSISFSQTTEGKATWYAYNSVRRTASGEIFKNNGMTCASNIHKLGTILKVTNIENGKSVIVRVNDRGGFKSPKIIDLAKGAFTQIALTSKGVINVIVVVINN